jgi:hypothetical protein
MLFLQVLFLFRTYITPARNRFNIFSDCVEYIFDKLVFEHAGCHIYNNTPVICFCLVDSSLEISISYQLFAFDHNLPSFFFFKLLSSVLFISTD